MAVPYLTNSLLLAVLGMGYTKTLHVYTVLLLFLGMTHTISMLAKFRNKWNMKVLQYIFSVDVINSHTKSSIIKSFGYMITTRTFKNTLGSPRAIFLRKNCNVRKNMYISLCDFETHY